ncbi:MAG TPA: diadenylate cyclase [Polyangiaceae bacterium]
MPARFWEFAEGLLANVRLADVLDVLIVSSIAYGTVRWFRQSRSRLVMSGLATLVLLYFAARLLEMHLTLALFQAGITVAAVTLVVIFQDEIKRGFERVALASRFRTTGATRNSDTLADTIAAATAHFAKNRTGALVVFRGREPLERHLTGGVRLDGRVSESLLYSIFDTNSPGHDGALIIEDGVASLFAVHLPLSVEIKGGERFGTRHTAALGLSERCDALVIVVSEERGVMSVAQNGKLTEVSSSLELAQIIRAFSQKVSPDFDAAGVRRWFSHNLGLKLVSVAVALAAWLVTLGYRSETAVRTVSVPIVFSDVPNGWVIKNVNPLEVRLSLSGPQRKLEGLGDSLAVSVKPGKLAPGTLRTTLTGQDVSLPPGVQVRDIQPSSVQFTAERSVTTDVSVEADTRGPPAPGYALRSVTVQPQGVRLVLPESQRAKVRRVATEPIDLTSFRTSATVRVPVLLPTGAALAPGEPEVVSVRIEVAARR